MNKDEAKEWMVANHLAQNEYNANKIWDGLKLWKFEEFDQQVMVYRYRELRQTYHDPKVCYSMVLREFKHADSS